MKKMQRIEEYAHDLIMSGSRIYLGKTKKYWILVFKDNEKSTSAKIVLGLRNIEKFLYLKLCEKGLEVLY